MCYSPSLARPISALCDSRTYLFCQISHVAFILQESFSKFAFQGIYFRSMQGHPMQQHPGYPPQGYRPPIPPMYRPGGPPGTPGMNRPPAPQAVKRPPPQGMLSDSQKIKPVKQKKPGDRLLPPSVRDLVPESQGSGTLLTGEHSKLLKTADV